MLRDFDYRARRYVTIAYKAGIVYYRVPEAAWRKIEEAGAGELPLFVDQDEPMQPAVRETCAAATNTWLKQQANNGKR